VNCYIRPYDKDAYTMNTSYKSKLGVACKLGVSHCMMLRGCHGGSKSAKSI